MSNKKKITVDQAIANARAYMRDVLDGMIYFVSNLRTMTPDEYQSGKELTRKALNKLIIKSKYVSELTVNPQLCAEIKSLEEVIKSKIPDLDSPQFDRILASILEIDRACDSILTQRKEWQTTQAAIAKIKAAATRAAKNTDKIVDELSAWRKWIKGGCKCGGKKNGNQLKLFKSMSDAILEKWERYKEGEADCELPSGKLRTTKRTFAEFFEMYGATIIYTSKVDGKRCTLKQMCRTVKELKTAIDSAQKSERRASKKAARRKTDNKNGQQKM